MVFAKEVKTESAEVDAKCEQICKIKKEPRTSNDSIGCARNVVNSEYCSSYSSSEQKTLILLPEIKSDESYDNIQETFITKEECVWDGIDNIKSENVFEPEINILDSKLQLTHAESNKECSYQGPSNENDDSSNITETDEDDIDIEEYNEPFINESESSEFEEFNSYCKVDMGLKVTVKELFIPLVDVNDKSFRNRYTLKTYKKGSTSSLTIYKRHTCDICSYRTAKISHLNRHKKRHLKSKLTSRYNCQKCKKTFLQIQELDKHAIECHKEDKITDTDKNHTKLNGDCDKGTKLSKTRGEDQASQENKTTKCMFCSKLSVNRWALAEHIPSCHISEVHKVKMKKIFGHRVLYCDKCSYATVIKSKFNIHMISKHKIDSGVTKLSCYDCNFTTYCKGTLKRHVLTHMKNKPFRCKFCAKSFIRQCVLDGHLLTKHKNKIPDMKKKYGDKISKCSLCQYETMRPQHLRRHMLSHETTTEEDKKFKCHKCKFASRFKSCLTRHINTHEAVRPYLCDFCDRGFNERTFLNAPVRKMHA